MAWPFAWNPPLQTGQMGHLKLLQLHLPSLILIDHQVAPSNSGLHAISQNSFLTDPLVERKKRRRKSSFSTFYVFFLGGGERWWWLISSCSACFIICLTNFFFFFLGTVMDDILPFFDGDCWEVKVMDCHARISGSDFDHFVLSMLTHCQNDGSYLYLLTPVLSPPSTDCVTDDYPVMTKVS